MGASRKYPARDGFTLIELSIVLVVIGLIVGGILVGQTMIGAATVRAQITQIEKFNQAANTFYGKYGFLPGDIPQAAVTQFGFTTNPIRPGGHGCGDGNGEIDGVNGNCPSAGSWAWLQGGETAYFWQDLSANSHLIEGGLTAASLGSFACTSNSACGAYFPSAKTGNGAFVYVYSGYAANYYFGGPTTGLGPNFFGLSIINSVLFGSVNSGAIPPAPALTVAQAAAIDTKIDDGFPTTGNVLAQYLGTNNGAPGWSTNGATPSATTCYDTSSGTAKYSISYQNGAMVNCGISFKMQAGDQ
jgi:prepilin-type N-terminal cleavage/methylation domain-containing protein